MIIPKEFSRLQVIQLLIVMVGLFYLFLREFTAAFDQFDIAVQTHQEIWPWILVAGTGIFGSFLSGLLIHEFVVRPWKDRRLNRRLETERVQLAIDKLNQNRPLIAEIENAMESFFLMVHAERYKKQRVKRP